MADAWGGSWGTSWADSWGAGVAAPVVQQQPGGGGRKKKRGRVIRWSDFESREEFERAFRAVAPELPPAPIPIEEDEDDEIVANLLMVMH